MKTKLQLYFFLLALLSLPGLAHAQGTAFNYQGRLVENGVPASGLYDFVFTVHPSEVGGGALGVPVPLNAVAVSAGQFVVPLDFGAGVFAGAPRWLQIAVRVNGVGPLVTLAPRQALLPTPYATFAASAGGVASGSVTANQLNTGVAPTAGQFLSYNGGSLAWTAPGVAAGNIWSLNGSSAYYNAGNVGIGTTAPSTYGHGGTARILEINNSGTTLHSQAHLMLFSGVNSIADSAMGSVTWAQPGGMAAYIGAQTRSTTPNAPSATLTFGTRQAGDGGPSPRMVITEAGNVGIGTITPTPGYRLEVVGATILRPGNGTVQFGTPNAEIGMSITPTAGNRADLRFDGSVLKLLAGTGVGPPSSLNGINISTAGYVGIGATSPGFKLDVFSDTSTAIVGRSTVISGVGVYGESAQFNGVRGVANNVNHGAVVGVHNSGGLGVLGLSSGTGVQGESTSVGGFGGYFRNTAGGIALGVQGTARVGVLQITGGADLAEPFKMSHEHIAKGSVVVIDEDHPGQLKLSDKSYDRRVAGIVSGANGVNPGISLQQEGVLEGGQNVSLSGRVYVQADASHGSIKPGDLLTTSDTPGHAMKVSDSARSQGAILGKAMSALKEGKGMVLVLVTLQ